MRWQPVSPTLMARLVEHGRERHAPTDGQLLRYADGRPIGVVSVDDILELTLPDDWRRRYGLARE